MIPFLTRVALHTAWSDSSDATRAATDGAWIATWTLPFAIAIFPRLVQRSRRPQIQELADHRMGMMVARAMMTLYAWAFVVNRFEDGMVQLAGTIAMGMLMALPLILHDVQTIMRTQRIRHHDNKLARNSTRG